jgi:uncharacterized low-complexity protein
MSVKHNSKPLALLLGTTMTATLAGMGAADASENPFSMTSLPGGYLQVTEGKCGEGKCGMRQMDADGDGKVTRDEFMQGHEVMFTVIDANGDGVIDAAERAAHRAGKSGGCKMD